MSAARRELLSRTDVDLASALDTARDAADDGHTIVLLEGVSDELAFTALASRRGHDLDAECVTTVAIGGATNIRQFLDMLGPRGLDADVAGLCDQGEERLYRRALEDARFGSNLTRADIERLGFYVCEADLEEELIRAAGVATVLEVAAGQRELAAFRTFQRQPQWAGQPDTSQLRRWLGVSSRRKARYAMLLVQVMDLGRAPAPLERLLAHAVRDE